MHSVHGIVVIGKKAASAEPGAILLQKTREHE